MKRYALILILAFCLPMALSAQVGITESNSDPDPSAMLDVQATDKGMLVPRMTAAEREAIVNPAEGLIVYDTEADAFWRFDNGIWQPVGGRFPVVTSSTATAGDVRWNPATNDFEGYNGTGWISLVTGETSLIFPATETQKATASDGSSPGFFGYSVSIDEEYAIVGAWLDTANGFGSGAAYIFHYDGSNWTEQTKLTPSDAAINDHFGFSVSIDGDYAIVGNYQGGAYIFHYDGSSWIEQTKLTAGNDFFGHSVSIDGNYAIVGDWGDDVNGNNSGAAYIFHYDGSSWIEQTKLTASDGAGGDRLGFSVSIDGNYAILGAFLDNHNGVTDVGSAYIFRYDGSNWTEQTKLTASDGAANDYFGYSVSIDGDYVIVGALQSFGPSPSPGPGSAYIFHYDGNSWTEQTKLTASDAALGDRFGFSVSIDGDYVIVGAPYDDDNGSAYIFRYNGSSWIEQTKLTASDGVAYDQFGSVSISGGSVIVGAFDDDDNGPESGSVYFFQGQ